MGLHLQTEIGKLKTKLLMLSAMVEANLSKAVQAVLTGDHELAQKVIKLDEDVDMKEIDVEEECLKILALHQPVAIDLRFVISALKINNDLERIGDLTSNIAYRSMHMSKETVQDMPFDFEDMASKTRQMLQKAINSLVNMDVALAHEVCRDDDEIDQINRNTFKITRAKIKENPEKVEYYLNWRSISKHLERIGDYATNISEDIIYMIEGVIVRHSYGEIESDSEVITKD